MVLHLVVRSSLTVVEPKLKNVKMYNKATNIISIQGPGLHRKTIQLLTISQSRKINTRKTWPKMVVLHSEIACCRIYQIQCWHLITNIQSKADNVLSCQTRSNAAFGVCVEPLLNFFPPLSVLHS